MVSWEREGGCIASPHCSQQSLTPTGVLAVTRSLGDQAMKEFVVGSPYTTETCLSDEDKFLIVACDGVSCSTSGIRPAQVTYLHSQCATCQLWDVIDDQDAVDLIAEVQDAQEAAEKLLAHALGSFSTDNTSVMVIRFASGAASLPSACAAAVAADQSVFGKASAAPSARDEEARTGAEPRTDADKATHDAQAPAQADDAQEASTATGTARTNANAKANADVETSVSAAAAPAAR